ncbi:MAG: FAD-binding protein [Deltaproteobacteria bacterium]|jgi:aspartate oxidase|nr:FAD-binding protein [Deltaproteobacteria bacterium]
MVGWTFDTQTLEGDVLVIGGGFAALHAALAAAENKVSVIVASKGRLGYSGASAVSMSVHRFGPGPYEALEKYAHFMLDSGYGLGQPEMIRTFVAEAPGIPEYLSRFKLELEIKTVEIEARTYPNFVASPSKRGMTIGRSIRPAVLEAPNVSVWENWAVADLKPVGSGWLAWLEKDGQLKPVAAKAVVLATGGALGLYAYHSGTPELLGEGLALAFELGCCLRDLEFVQFYPYRIYWPKICDIFPDIFDHGAKFLNGDSIRFMNDYPKKELENRDVLAREIYRQAQTSLDLSEADHDFLQKETKKLYNIYQKFPDKRLLVRPVAHFTMGGICVDGDGQTARPGLLAAGEIVGGLHGANRLAGHALSETVVFGRRAGQAAARWAAGVESVDLTNRPTPNLPSPGDDEPKALLKQLKNTMWAKAGLIRDEKGLQEGWAELEELRRKFSHLRPRNLQSWLSLNRALTVADLMVKAALLRRESRGAHFREDFPNTSEQYRGSFVFKGSKVCFEAVKGLN